MLTIKKIDVGLQVQQSTFLNTLTLSVARGKTEATFTKVVLYKSYNGVIWGALL